MVNKRSKSSQQYRMEHDGIPDVFWDALRDLSFDDTPPEAEEDRWWPDFPAGLTGALEVAEASLTFGRMIHLVGDPASSDVAYTHVLLRQGHLGMRLYFPARPVPGALGIAGFVIAFRDLPQVRDMYAVQRVLDRVNVGQDARSAYGQAVSAATVNQAVRALAGLARMEALPFMLLPLHQA
jgi:hypothetical protein